MDRHNIFDSITGAFVPLHKDGHKFVAGFAIATLLLFFLATPLGWIGLIATAWCAYFFRDPERVTPMRDGLVVSAADGKITSVDEAVPPQELGLGSMSLPRISVFLTIFDVHINRSPATGRITRSIYRPGLFLNAELDKASEDNERRSLLIETPSGAKVGVVLIAGLIARRIVTSVDEGASILGGERIGLIRFGSRVDVYLPATARPLVAVGQMAVGGETILADLNGAAGLGAAGLGVSGLGAVRVS